MAVRMMHFAQTLQATLRFHSWNEREQKTEEKLPVAFAWNLERVQLCVRVACGSALMSQCISCEEFDDDKASGKLDIALGKVPVLEVGDFSLPQSKAIERYLARKLDMMGDSEEEEALVDAMAEHVRDINDAYQRKGVFFMKDEEKKAELQKKWYEEDLPDWLSKLEKALPGSGGFAVGSKASLADVVIFKLLKDTYPDDVSAAYDACPKIKAIVEGIEKNEGITKWLEERPKTFI
eukprot:s2313_g13.t1